MYENIQRKWLFLYRAIFIDFFIFILEAYMKISSQIYEKVQNGKFNDWKNDK